MCIFSDNTLIWIVSQVLLMKLKLKRKIKSLPKGKNRHKVNEFI